jgi:hypothetical protein
MAVEDHLARFIVRDANGQALSCAKIEQRNV